ncbi:MAG: hypothetical protein ACRC12_01735, partial [Holosporales bacterium]
MKQKERSEKMTKKQKTTMGICFLLTFGTFISQQVFADAQQTATDAAMIGYDVSGTLEGNPMSAIDLDKRLDKYTHINQKAVDLEKKLDEKTGIKTDTAIIGTDATDAAMIGYDVSG